MPITNLMVPVNKVEPMIEVDGTDIHGVTQSHPVNKQSSGKQFVNDIELIWKIQNEKKTPL